MTAISRKGGNIREKEEKSLKIVLTFDDMDSVAEQCLIEWLQEKVKDKSSENLSPLRYVKGIKWLERGLRNIAREADLER